ncbi:translation elongation factor Ts [Acuticoccus sp. I52.16.1]|uniref:translation elongation factor Ts n=1 Tax=Acuticoccus sp. I52.16.1 TaxID=2928472 RepID=UPI001FD4F320|nr:translation elongation factor Ts [Acuticoccus sp. I52.16.1]UOM34815.1 translation elongation factor Ts [Acuticoccus sp. I52.16.1]
MTITAQQVKALREKTGVGMMDCKTALNETGGDMEAAVDWLRKKGLSKAAKKADRVAAEGLIGAYAQGTKAALVEVNSETDFVGRNEIFQKLVSTIAAEALASGGDIDALKAQPFPGSSRNVGDEVTESIATIGENLTLRRTAMLEVAEGTVATYIHNAVAPGLGKLGVLVAMSSSGDKDKLDELGRKIAMHIAAVGPLALTPDEVPAEAAERERAVYSEQARASGKPESIIEKMVEGRMRKFYEEVVLLKQAFVVNPDQTVEQAVKEAEGDIGGPIQVTGFVRFVLGEGIEKEESDFAAEVAAAAGH